MSAEARSIPDLLAALEKSLAAVRERHVAITINAAGDDGPICRHCQHRWPCPTAQEAARVPREAPERP